MPQDPQNYQGIVAPDGKPYVIAQVPFTPYTDQNYVVMESPGSGGVEWPDPSWDPNLKLEVVCANIFSRALEAPPANDQHPVISQVQSIIQWRTSSAPNALTISRLVAFNPATNKIVWKHDDLATGGPAAGRPATCVSPVTTTASGLSLIGRVVPMPQYPNGVGVIQAYDTKTGAFDWQIPVLVNGQAVPVVPRITPYMVNGKEYLVSFTHFSTAGADISAYTLP